VQNTQNFGLLIYLINFFTACDDKLVKKGRNFMLQFVLSSFVETTKWSLNGKINHKFGEQLNEIQLGR
jgi:hypothetical protein